MFDHRFPSVIKMKGISDLSSHFCKLASNMACFQPTLSSNENSIENDPEKIISKQKNLDNHSITSKSDEYRYIINVVSIQQTLD